ncbi:class I SAM-dependent methyltransferase [Sunxiuqinia sp. sy24]|uniref:class I SAM-dependent methyltransferase n=1 Tax=Sunxiuqinia sp. sy24 TaxID=3461495 RepID=UPI0040463D7B
MFLPDEEEEKERYLEHNNGLHHPGYVKFLNQAIRQGRPFLLPEMKGLDFGCGPEPTLSVLLEKQGIACADYDPIFFPELSKGPYDFIFATECFEHFFHPAEELKKISQLLSPGGYLIVMTSLWKLGRTFRSWNYARDITHVAFYHAETFCYICKHYGFKQLGGDQKRVIILQKQ